MPVTAVFFRAFTFSINRHTLPGMGDDEPIILMAIEKKGRLVLLHFSNEAVFRATPATVQQLGLAEKIAFSPDGYRHLADLLERRFAWCTAETTLAQRAASIGEFKRKLKRKEIADRLISEIVTDFKEKGLLGDYAYAVAKTRSFLEHKPAGEAFLVSQLQKHLVPRLIAEKAVKEVLAETDETDIALRLLQKRSAALAKLDLETARRKAYTYLARRAIPYGAAKKAFDKLFGKL
ncbi:MAG: RecX family transcriptional regulator [candidate division Zixibacteria bacterium]|nr:RecX family transcriptional regulator [candidate division Zixibacteria bacterium]